MQARHLATARNLPSSGSKCDSHREDGWRTRVWQWLAVRLKVSSSPPRRARLPAPPAAVHLAQPSSSSCGSPLCGMQCLPTCCSHEQPWERIHCARQRGGAWTCTPACVCTVQYAPACVAACVSLAPDNLLAGVTPATWLCSCGATESAAEPINKPGHLHSPTPRRRRHTCARRRWPAGRHKSWLQPVVAAATAVRGGGRCWPLLEQLRAQQQVAQRTPHTSQSGWLGTQPASGSPQLCFLATPSLPGAQKLATAAVHILNQLPRFAPATVRAPSRARPSSPHIESSGCC